MIYLINAECSRKRKHHSIVSCSVDLNVYFKLPPRLQVPMNARLRQLPQEMHCSTLHTQLEVYIFNTGY